VLQKGFWPQKRAQKPMKSEVWSVPVRFERPLHRRRKAMTNDSQVVLTVLLEPRFWDRCPI
jgi:hypothetical protein